MSVRRLIAGGQTGVDRAALDLALAHGIECGAWCPAGRRAEDGPIAAHYPLTETASADYAERTRRNVLEADATLVLCQGALSGGTLLTVQMAGESDKPCLVVDLRRQWQPAEVGAWLQACEVACLNVAGPRESSAPGIYARARDYLQTALLPDGP